MTPAVNASESAAAILDIAYGFRSSKALLTAIELDVFSVLGNRVLDLEELTSSLRIHKRGARDFLDALVALRLLERGIDGRYSNTAATAAYLDRNKPTYIGGPLEQLNQRLYADWSHLTPALRSGLPQSEALGRGGYDSLYADQTASGLFLRAMTGGTLLPAQTLAANFPWKNYRRLVDIGTAEGCLPVHILSAHQHLTAVGFDLPEVESAFEAYVARHGMTQRVEFQPGNFFIDPLPKGDVLVMGRILHNWNLRMKTLLLEKAYDALPGGGSLIIYDPLIDDARRENAFGLLSSLNMLIETPGGFEYTGAECAAWMQAAGFQEVRIEPLACRHFATIGVKPAVISRHSD
jgi:hypothetical protein